MKIKFLSIFSVAVLALSSCSSSDFDENNGNENGNGNDVELSDVEVKFGSSLALSVKPQSSPLTRAHDAEWDSGDKIGIYMIKDGVTWNSSAEIFRNSKYTTTAEKDGTTPDYSIFTAVNNPMYYPTQNTVSFVAYYPYSDDPLLTAATPTYPINVTDQSDQNAIDFLYASRKSGFDKTSETVQLDFKHILSKIILKIIPGPGVSLDEVEKVKVTMKGLIRDGEYNLTKSITNNDINSAFTEGSKGPISGFKKIDFVDSSVNPIVEDVELEGILIPQTLDDTIEWEFDVNGEIFTFKPINVKTTSLDMSKYEPGKKYVYTITILKTEVEVEGKILDWILGGEGAGIAS